METINTKIMIGSFQQHTAREDFVFLGKIFNI